MDGVDKVVLALEQEQVEAFNKGDIEKIITYYDPMILGFSSTKHDRFVGLEDLRKTFEYYLQKTSKLEYSISDPSVQVFGEMAIVSFYWLVVMVFGKTRREIQGRGSHVYKKMAGGWKIVHEHFSRAHHAYEK